jgi:pimeloyl-ACP methyl ester carboxylesterase
MAYVDAAGLRTYYEVHGEGAPVVLLHGALAGAESWSAQTPALAAAPFTVYVPERRGHGRTPDVPGPLTYAAMAEDTAGFLEAVVGGPAHLVGWSDGAVVGALVAMERPELVDRLVLIGQYYNSSGRVPGGVVDQLAQWRETPPGFLREMHEAVSPEGPGHFRVLLDKILDMVAREPEIPLEEFARIQAPTLVLQGDRDEVHVTHSAAVTEAIPGARLAVLPGTHALPLESPALVNDLVTIFLNGGPKPLDLGSLTGD